MNSSFKTSILDRRDFLRLGFLTTAAALTSACSISAREKEEIKSGGKNLTGQIEYKIKDFSYLLGTLDGLSESQLKAHFTLYENYVNGINKVEAAIKGDKLDDKGKYRALLAAETYALNGAVLHELYFGNLKTNSKGPKGTLKKLIERDFGSQENFIGHLKLAGAVMRGWAIAAYNYRSGGISIYGLDTHNELGPALTYPILVLDVYEHAYMIDYGIDRGKYLDAFIKNIAWEPVEKRLELALSIPAGEAVTA